MNRHLKMLLFPALWLIMNSCGKEEITTTLQDHYEPTVQEAGPAENEFTVNLHARALQNKERGEWKIIEGLVVENYVYFEDRNNPFSKFKGLPGKDYTLEWTRWDIKGNASSVKTNIKIPDLHIEIVNQTQPSFETILTFNVDPKYKGRWSFDKSFAYTSSRYFDGSASAPEDKPSIELHGYSNTDYTATFTYTYAGKTYQFKKLVRTGDYTQDEALYELQLNRGNHRIVEDDAGNILELNLQASGIAWLMEDLQQYPSLQAFKKLRRLILGGSSISKIPEVVADHYTSLEELSMDGVGKDLVIPQNIGNLTKLKTLHLVANGMSEYHTEVKLPSSFGKLKALESFSVHDFGYIDFNGTLGGLTNLKRLSTDILVIPENVGELKNLEYLNVVCKNLNFPKRLNECKSLRYLRVVFHDFSAGKVVLSPEIGDLKELVTLEIRTTNLTELPQSLTELTSLKNLSIESKTLNKIPEDIGNLSNLENLTLHGTFTRLPNSFGMLTKLTHLFLRGKIELLPETFVNLSSLAHFDAEATSLESLPDNFGNLKSLKYLNLSLTKMKSLPNSFSGLDALEQLNLGQAELTSFPKSIIPLKRIYSVNLSSNPIGKIPDEISAMKIGVKFDLFQIPTITVEHIKYIASITNGILFHTSDGLF